MDGKVVIVTGVNSGIGYITAKELVRCGATVIGTVRSMDKASFATELNKHSRGKLIPMKLDLASLASVKAFHSKFAALELPLHVAVWNAGVMMTPPGLTEDGVETQFATKYYTPASQLFVEHTTHKCVVFLDTTYSLVSL